MNSRNTLKLLTIAVALIFTLGSQAAMAKGGPGGPRHGGGHEKGIVGCVMKLDLSTETLESIQSLLDVAREAGETERETMEATRAAYVEALTASEIDGEALEQAKTALMDLHQAHAEERFALDLSVVELLGADELADLAECMAEPREIPVE